MLKRLGEDAGTIALVLSIIAIIIGIKSGNFVVIGLGAYSFMKLVKNICDFVDRKAMAEYNLHEAKSYYIKKQADTKAQLLAKAYKDNKISDEDISFLVKSLAYDNNSHKMHIDQIPTYSNPVIEVKQPVNTNQVKEIEAKEDEENNLVVPFEIVSGKFTFKYNGKDMAFGANDVTKGEYPHEEFSDSIGYYKNADAVFYIYPKEKQIAIVNI
jgi:hypothetical protein